MLGGARGVPRHPCRWVAGGPAAWQRFAADTGRRNRPMPALPFDFVVAALVTLLGRRGPHRARAGVPWPHQRVAASGAAAGGRPRGDYRVRAPHRQRAVRRLTVAAMSISLPAFRIAGGLLLFSIASEMVFGVRIARRSKPPDRPVEEHERNIAAFPLAIPLMAGPARSPRPCCSRAWPAATDADRPADRHHRDRDGRVRRVVPAGEPDRAVARRDRQDGARACSACCCLRWRYSS